VGRAYVIGRAKTAAAWLSRLARTRQRRRRCCCCLPAVSLECGDSASLSFLPSPSISLFFPTTEPIWLLNPSPLLLRQSHSHNRRLQNILQSVPSSPDLPPNLGQKVRKSSQPLLQTQSRLVCVVTTRQSSERPPAPSAPVAPTPSSSPSSSYLNGPTKSDPATSNLTASTQQGPPVTGPQPPADQASSAQPATTSSTTVTSLPGP